MKKWLQNFRQLKLNTKFSVVVVLLVAIPMLIFNLAFFKFTREGMMYQITNDAKNSVAAETEQMEKIIELCSMTSQVFIGDEQLQDFLTSLKQKREITAQEYLDFSRNHITLYEGMINSNPYIYQIHVYADNDQFSEMLPILYHKSRLAENVWNESKEVGTWYFDSVAIDEEEEENLASMVTGITNIFGEKVGVLEVSVKMDDFFSGIFASGSENRKCFINKGGKIIADPEDSFFQDNKTNLQNKTESDDSYICRQMELNQKKYLVIFQKIKEISGTYVSIVNVDEKLHSISEQQIKILVSMLFLFAGMIVLVNMTVNILLHRFYETIKIIQTIRDGNMDSRICNPGNDEIGILGKQVNKMLDRIQLLMQENINREVLIKNTEIKALQNQINSHFIYNVLESVKMMAEIDEEYLISDAVTALGELLRYNMKWISHNVTVREEINYIKNYIQLMNIRYDFEILLNIKIEDPLYDQEIPKMSLQPIVENAICHGIVENGEDAVIYIKTTLFPDRFEIAITDSGVGMNEEQLKQLERKIQGEIETSGGAGNGIGLKNVQDRIKMQCGEQYGLHFYSKEGCYTKVCVILPLKQGDKS